MGSVSRIPEVPSLDYKTSLFASNKSSLKGTNKDPTTSYGSILGLQSTIGNQAVQRLLQSQTKNGILGKKIQAKLKVSQIGDPYELEADHIANMITDKPIAHLHDKPISPSIQRFSERSNGEEDSAPVSVEQALNSSGRPLDSKLRKDMEQRFLYDFSHVRVYTGSAAAESAQEVSARAYTVGPNIVFGEGEFMPGTLEGKHLIAHELTHVIQQTSIGGMNVALQRAPSEEEAKAALSAASREYLDTVEVVGDFIEEQTGHRLHSGLTELDVKGNMPKKSDLIKELRKIEQSGNSRASKLVEDITEASDKVKRAERELSTVWRAKAVKAKIPSTDTGGSTKFEAATEGTAKEAGVKLASSIDPLHELKLSKVESFALKAGDIIEGFVPDPTDVLQLWEAYAGYWLGGKKHVEDLGYLSGFSQGLAANIYKKDWSWVYNKLVLKDKFNWNNASVAGYEGYRERAHNKGLQDGFNRGKTLSSKLIKQLGNEVILGLKKYDRTFKDDDIEGEEVTEGFVRDAGFALRSTVSEYLAKKEAIQREKEEKAEMERDMERRSKKWNVGNKF